MATLRPDEASRSFIARRATQRGVHSAQGRPHWPNPNEGKALADSASLVGEHQFSGAGVPDGFRFSLAQANDVMPALALTSADQGGATALEWNALPTARGYFAGAMASRSEAEMVIWSSSELPDSGFGLFDYQTNAAVERWVKEKVLLEPGTTRCTVPKGVLPAEGAMLRLIAYGPELNLVHPPRPADARAAWEPQWAVKLRVKSMATSMAGMPSMGEAMKGETGAPGGQAGAGNRDDAPRAPGAVDLLLLSCGDIGSDRLRRALHRFGSHLPIGQKLHLPAPAIKWVLVAHNRLHTAHPWRKLLVLYIEFDIGRKLAVVTVRTQVIGTRYFDFADRCENSLSA